MSPSSFRAALFAAALVAPVAACAEAPTEQPDGVSASSAAGAESTAADTHPVTIENCGTTVTVESLPTRLVTLNQGATEVALALGLDDVIVGTAYLDDAIAPQFKDAYNSVPVLSAKYPSLEQFTAANPDFAYAVYASAFSDKGVGSVAELKTQGINAFLSPFGCPQAADKAPATFESVWGEIETVANIFGRTDKATEVIDDQQQRLEAVTSAMAGDGLKILWYDSGDKTPYVGAGGGSPQVLMDAVGATNIFADLEGGWADGSWERVAAENPDVIVLADASWDEAETKRAHLRDDPALAGLDAVIRGRFVTLPFSETTAGVRLIDGAESLSEQLAALPSE